MGRRKKGDKVNGWVNLNKPEGMTSTQALGKVRWALNAQKAGHAGTLDPLASGILPIALGEATKTIHFAQDALKTYVFTVQWGQQRSTDDAEGEVIAASDQRPSKDDIEALLPEFSGEIEQVPPQFSAVKIHGQRAYDLAREGGEAIDIKSREVTVESLKISPPYPPASGGEEGAAASSGGGQDQTTFECVCGKGTYIRSLARDMGQKLGCYGYVAKLERTAVGPFRIEDAISLDIFEDLSDKPPLESVVLPVETVLDDIPALALRDQEAARLKQGQRLSFIAKPDMERIRQAGIEMEDTALATYKGKAIALVTIDGPIVQPLRVLNN